MNRIFPLILAIAPLTACGSIDPEPPTDEDGQPIPKPGPFDDWLRVVATTPDGGEVGVRPTIRVTFDAYLDHFELLDYAALEIRSGGLRTQGRVTYEMTTRSLVFTPITRLEPGLTYRLFPSPDYLVSVTGAPLQIEDLPAFQITEEGSSGADRARPDADWAAVDALLQAKCRSCHSDPGWDLNPLTRESLVSVRSEQVDQFVVVPFSPAASYLMHKILPDYPLRRFTVQPPPWSDAAPLEPAEILLVETWIENGAR